MTALILKMTSWLIVSMVLGFVVAWLLARIIYQRREGDEDDAFSVVLLERNNMIDKLEKNFRNEQVKFEKLSNDFKDSKKALAEKISLVTTLGNRLANVNFNENDSLVLKQKNDSLLIKIKKFEQTDIKRVAELEGFEEILLLAEEKIEENERTYKRILQKLDDEIELLILENEKNEKRMKLYVKTIKDLKKELTLYEADSSAPEFIISRDQFLKIEEQLNLYQKEIKSLKNKNSELFLKSKKSLNEDRTLEYKTIAELHKESNDSSMVKVFRETYKKITKS
jgi:hypothetical protein